MEKKVGAKPIPFERLSNLLAEQRRRTHYGEDRPGLTDARQPEQPRSGLGGSAYSHKEVKSNLYGGGSLAYWVFEPTVPSLASAPLIIFLHGWGGGSPVRFGAWIDHLVKRGNLVVFPIYQGSLRPWSKPWEQIPAARMLENAIAAVKNAIKCLQKGDHVKPDLERCAIIGFSLGGALTAQMAAVAARNDLPIPKAIMPVAPGRGLWARSPLPFVELRTILSSTLMLVIVCEDDKNAGDHEGKAIFTQTPQIPLENKNLVIMVSDYHGSPPLVANHNSPTASNSRYWMGERDLTAPNAMHYYGYWKLFDGLIDTAFYQRNRAYALGNTLQQRFMGTWSDGVPIKELKVITHSDIIGPLPFRKFRFMRGKRW
jgi:poly(3-hydroxybutyrate) depolymerase